jgi:hypothetical protein
MVTEYFYLHRILREKLNHKLSSYFLVDSIKRKILGMRLIRVISSKGEIFDQWVGISGVGRCLRSCLMGSREYKYHFPFLQIAIRRVIDLIFSEKFPMLSIEMGYYIGTFPRCWDFLRDRLNRWKGFINHKGRDFLGW